MYAQVACLFTLLHISTFLTNKQKYMQGEGGGGGGQQNKIKNTKVGRGGDKILTVR